MKIAIVPVTPFQQNCSVIIDEATGKAAVVDPGGDLENIMATLEKTGAKLERILVTHGHVDHVGGALELASLEGGLPIEGPHQADRYWIEGLPDQCRMFGLPQQPRFVPDRWLEQGDTVTVGRLTLEVLHCPGHTPGHVVFFDRAGRLALVGDVLFEGSIGRTDFPGGDYDTLIASIKGRLLPLGDDVTFIPGHGPTSTLGSERQTNPFLVGRTGYP